MEFVPRIKTVTQTNREPYAIPPKCGIILEKRRLEKKLQPVLQNIDPSKILALLSSFNHRSAGGMEKQLNRYFMAGLCARCVFITTFINQEVQIRAIGTRKLKYLYRKILEYGLVDKLLQKCISCRGQPLGQLHPQVHNCFEEMLEGHEGDIISVPILAPEESAIKFLLLSILDSRKDIMFIVKFVHETFQYCLPTLLNTIISNLITTDRMNRDRFVTLLSSLYQSFQDLNQVVKSVLTEATEITNSTEGILYLVDSGYNNISCRVFSTLADKIDRLDLLKHEGIAGKSARTGKSIIIKRNRPELLEALKDVKVKCMFSFPIVYEGKLVCVIQLYNKRGGDYVVGDCDIASMFCNYCGEILAKAVNYEKLQVMEKQSQFSYSMLTYHIKFLDASIEHMLQCPHSYSDFGTFEFEPRAMDLADTATWAMKIFERLKLLERFNIDRRKFAKFILHIKFGYHDLPYNNWLLAFTALHFAYAVISSLKLIDKNILSKFEAFALLICCMAHSLDFRGHVNAFKLQVGAMLENMYTSTGQIMDIHHFTQLMHLMRLNECNILENIDNKTYINFLQVVNQMILLTDLTKSTFLRTAPVVPYGCVFGLSIVPPRIKCLILCTLMHTSILSDFIKDFKTSVAAFKLIHEEINQSKDYAFLPHNDLPEIVQLHDLPQLHSLFLKHLVRPSLLILSDLLPDLSQFLNSLHIVKLCWKSSRQIISSQVVTGKSSLEIIRRASFVDKVLAVAISTDERSELGDIASICEKIEIFESEEYGEEEEEEDSDDEVRYLLAALEEDSEDSLFSIGYGFNTIGNINI